MSTATHGKPTTIQERAIAATRRLCEELGLAEVSQTQVKYLTIALAETAIAEAKQNREFASEIRTKFEQMMAEPARKKNPSGSKVQEDIKLVPIKRVDASRLSPYTPPDPYILLEAYGESQLPLALDRFSVSMLSKIAAILEVKFPGTRPANKRQKDSLVAYIVEHVLQSN